MPPVESAGILLHRRAEAGGTEVWIAHMGGPFWAVKEERAWSIPKGELDRGADPFQAALREFEEENGVPAPALDYVLLGRFRQPSGKVITVFTAAFDGTLEWVSSNTFELEWPRGSGRIKTFPEIDRAGWFSAELARTKVTAGQVPILAALDAHLAGGSSTDGIR